MAGGGSTTTRSGNRPDVASLVGVLLAIGAIVGGLLLEGGKLSDIGQYTAAIIVLGGTMGATMLNTPLHNFIGGFRRLAHVFLEKGNAASATIEQIIEFATKARKNGIVSLEQEAALIPDPFLRKALTLAVDGTDLQELRRMMELEIEIQEHEADAEAKVFEQAGGYAPTVGILGAVMGLIQVMKNLANIDAVGHGIAVSFVATVYGVGIANLFFLPAAGKIKARAQQDIQIKEMMLEGVSGIVEGLNPKLIRAKLEAYDHAAAKRKQAVAKPLEKP
ncbi:MAG: flagellar motor protein [Acidobacteria bacterium]|nr:flagellar motor protein [Acidobacteriota bacterium]